MKIRKPRHQKFFNEKFPVNVQKIDCKIQKETLNIICNSFKEIKKYKGNSFLSNHELKEILCENELYNGSFYISPDLINFKLLNLNLEDVYLNLSKLDKQDHGDKRWCHNEDEFQKVFVIFNDGEYAFCVLNYNDSWSPLVIDRFNTLNTFFEGNICKNII